MPELPEVETVRRGLASQIEGARINRVILNRSNLRFAFEPLFVSSLEGAVIERLERRAKYLIFKLDNTQGFLVHLGMSGRFVLLADRGAPTTESIFYHRQNAPLSHDHVHFELEKGMQTMKLIYCDPRRFGFMELMGQSSEQHPRLALLGPEPLGEALTAEYMTAKFKKASRSLKALLLDQKIIAGLGNIYVCEALFGAALSPLMTGADLVRQKQATHKIERLVTQIQAVLQHAIQAGGSSLSDFSQVNGKPGYFQHCFHVYDRASQPCLRQGCDGEVVRVTQHNRASFFCPICQKI